MMQGIEDNGLIIKDNKKLMLKKYKTFLKITMPA